MLSLVGAQNEQADSDKRGLNDIHQQMVYRHIAWINALRVQLRVDKPWSLRENVLVERLVERHREQGDVVQAIAPFVSPGELEDLRRRQNVATHLVKNQARQLRSLRHDQRLIDGFDLVLLMKSVSDFYDLQGMCERIKNTPFPRQFAHFSKIFTVLFCLLVPLGLVDIFEEEFLRAADFAQTFNTRFVPPSLLNLMLPVPLSIVISIVFLTWEQIGDNSEGLFDGRPFDVSMTALCRTIEIDLRDMLDERHLPSPTEPKDDVLY